MAAAKYTCFFDKLLQLPGQQNLNDWALKMHLCIINTFLTLILKTYYVYEEGYMKFSPSENRSNLY